MIVPELLGEEEERITEAQALFQAATRATLLAGPALAGMLIGIVGATSVLLVDAATYVVAVVLVAGFVHAPAAGGQEDEHRDLRAGIRFIAQRPAAADLVADVRGGRRGVDGVLRRRARCWC